MTQILKLHKSRSLKKLNLRRILGTALVKGRLFVGIFVNTSFNLFWNDIATQFGCNIKQTFNQP